MKKKLRDCTYGEVNKLCHQNKKKGCIGCPLFRSWAFNICEELPECMTNWELDLEIEIPEEDA